MWIVVTVVGGILFLGYARVESPDRRRADAAAQSDASDLSMISRTRCL